MYNSFTKLAKQFKVAASNLFQSKMLAISICILLGIIIIYSIKDNTIDLFNFTTPTQSLPFPPEDPSDLIPVNPIAPTNAFTNFNMNFIKLYKDFKGQSNTNIGQMATQANIIDGLNTRVGTLINE
jgi:hypothetical protein